MTDGQPHPTDLTMSTRRREGRRLQRHQLRTLGRQARRLAVVLAAGAMLGVGGIADTVSAAPTGDVIRGKLKPENWGNVGGTAVLTRLGNKTRVVVTLDKPNPRRYPAHIHIGYCKLDPNFNLKAGLNDVVRGRSVTIFSPFPTWAELHKGRPSGSPHDGLSTSCASRTWVVAVVATVSAERTNPEVLKPQHKERRFYLPYINRLAKTSAEPADCPRPFGSMSET